MSTVPPRSSSPTSTSSTASSTNSNPAPPLDDSAFHIPPFHSFTHLSASSHSVVLRAKRHLPSPSSPTSSPSPSSAPSPSTPSPYSCYTPASEFALKFAINQTLSTPPPTRRFLPISPPDLSDFRRQFSLLHLLQHVPGVIRACELLDVQLALPSAPSSSTSLSVYSTLCLVTEYFPGKPLSSFYPQPRYASGFPLLELFPVALSLFSSLSGLHAAGLIHRDLSHNNLLYSGTLLHPRSSDGSGCTCLVDFGQAEQLGADSTEKPAEANAFRGTLSFVSPEQTGRMNRPVDRRSDLYSAGVLLYQMATGRLPFVSEQRDELELMHAIITKQPTPPLTLRPSLPPMLSSLIMKLLSKNADDRYQSAQGVERDLRTIHMQLQQALPSSPSSPRSDFSLTLTDEELLLSPSVFTPFALARDDIPSRLFIPNRLYGRTRQLSAIQSAFHTVVKSGDSAVISVEGVSGSGKSSVVRQAVGVIQASHPHCLLVSSKLDQFVRQPFGLLKPIVLDLVTDVLTQPSAVVLSWKQRVLKAVDGNGELVNEVFPPLQNLIGAQPAPTALPPTEAQQRLSRVITALFCAFCSASRPLLLFLDDVQWADDASMQQVVQVALHPLCRHALIILAYREDEVDSHHIVRISEEQLVKGHKPVERVHCGSLTPREMQELVVDTLRFCSDSTATTLASLLTQQTQGNPFFARQLLLQLHRGSSLVWTSHPEHQPPTSIDVERATGEWRFNHSAFIAQHGSTSYNVVDLVQQILQRVSPGCRRLLSLAACLGASFDTSRLQVVGECEGEVVEQAMREAVQEELLLLEQQSHGRDGSPPSAPSSPASPSDAHSSSSTPPTLPPPTRSRISYSFVHDRIQQGAYLCIPPDARTSTHLRIARQLLHHETSAGQRDATSLPDDAVFEIAGHYVKGLDAVADDEEERVSISEFCLQAARKAKAAGSYQNGLMYVKAAQRVVRMMEDEEEEDRDESSSSSSQRLWAEQYELLVSLAYERPELEFLNGDYAVCKRELEWALGRVTVEMDRVRLLELQVVMHTKQADYTQATLTGRRCLLELGLRLPLREVEMTDEEKATAQQLPVAFEHYPQLPASAELNAVIYAELERQLAGRSIPSLIDLPKCTDPRERMLTSVMCTTAVAVYLCDQTLLPAFCSIALIHMLRHGVTGDEVAHSPRHKRTIALHASVEQTLTCSFLPCVLLLRRATSCRRWRASSPPPSPPVSSAPRTPGGSWEWRWCGVTRCRCWPPRCSSATRASCHTGSSLQTSRWPSGRRAIVRAARWATSCSCPTGCSDVCPSRRASAPSHTYSERSNEP